MIKESGSSKRNGLIKKEVGRGVETRNGGVSVHITWADGKKK